MHFLLLLSFIRFEKGRKISTISLSYRALYFILLFFFSHLLFTFKQLLFYIERQFDIIYKSLCSEPVVPPYKKETLVSTLHTKI